MGVSENSVPLNPMVLMIIIPIKWLFHWEYTQHFQTNPYPISTSFGFCSKGLPALEDVPIAQFQLQIHQIVASFTDWVCLGAPNCVFLVV